MVHEWKDDPSSKSVIAAMITMMATMGNPQRIRTDGGPQFRAAEFQKFLERKGIEWCPSSPHFPSSNGHAEIMVKKVKHLLKKMSNATMDEEFQEAMLELRNTPRADGRSPNQVLFGRTLRSTVPIHHSAFRQENQVEIQNAHEKRRRNEEKATALYNSTARDLKDFILGDEVRIQDPVSKEWNKTGEIVKAGIKNRSYHVKLNNGKLLWRNRRFLRKFHKQYEINQTSYDCGDNEEEKGPRRSKRERKQTVRFSP